MITRTSPSGGEVSKIVVVHVHVVRDQCSSHQMGLHRTDHWSLLLRHCQKCLVRHQIPSGLHPLLLRYLNRNPFIMNWGLPFGYSICHSYRALISKLFQDWRSQVFGMLLSFSQIVEILPIWLLHHLGVPLFRLPSQMCSVCRYVYGISWRRSVVLDGSKLRRMLSCEWSLMDVVICPEVAYDCKSCFVITHSLSHLLNVGHNTVLYTLKHRSFPWPVVWRVWVIWQPAGKEKQGW